ncbi:MAG: heavy metal transporter [Clostridiales bacterium]|nr:heavy metal transporter [Clostridiales bacterium]
MKKTFRLKDLDCANCAAKMESRIAKLDGVNAVSISFMTQKMTLDAQDNLFDTVLEQAKKAIKKVDSAVEVL